jgi:hypothetical protein
MKRRTFDILVAVGGLFLAVTLIASGGLLTWAHTFIGNQVHTQLAAQKIYFPAAGSPAVAGPQFAAMRTYAGQQLTTGAQAETYADHCPAAARTYASASAATSIGWSKQGRCSPGPQPPAGTTDRWPLRVSPVSSQSCMRRPLRRTRSSPSLSPATMTASAIAASRS